MIFWIRTRMKRWEKIQCLHCVFIIRVAQMSQIHYNHHFDHIYNDHRTSQVSFIYLTHAFNSNHPSFSSFKVLLGIPAVHYLLSIDLWRRAWEGKSQDRLRCDQHVSAKAWRFHNNLFQLVHSCAVTSIFDCCWSFLALWFYTRTAQADQRSSGRGALISNNESEDEHWINVHSSKSASASPTWHSC